MKKLVLITTLVVLAAYVSGAALEFGKEHEPVTLIESFEEIDGSLAVTPHDFLSRIDARSTRVLFRYLLVEITYTLIGKILF